MLDSRQPADTLLSRLRRLEAAEGRRTRRVRIAAWLGCAVLASLPLAASAVDPPVSGPPFESGEVISAAEVSAAFDNLYLATTALENKPYLRCTTSAVEVAPDATVPFNNCDGDNVDFDPSAGDYTVPRDGLYLLSGHVEIQSGNYSATFALHLAVAEAVAPTEFTRIDRGRSVLPEMPNAITVLRMQAGDHFRFEQSGAGMVTLAAAESANVATAVWLGP